MNYRGIDISLDDVTLKRRLRIADRQKGLVIFSHGSGSSRLSIRNTSVSEGSKFNMKLV